MAKEAASTRPNLARMLAPPESALLVIDVQNDYCHKDGTLGRHGLDLSTVERAVANIERLIDAARAAGVAVIFVRNWHEPWANAPGWRERSERESGSAAAGSWGAGFYRVTPLPGEPVIDKQRYDAFIGTPLQSALRTLQRASLVFTGFGTNVCVESTARHAVFLDYRIALVSDATGTADGTDAHDATLATIANHFGRVATTDEIVAAWHDYRTNRSVYRASSSGA